MSITLNGKVLLTGWKGTAATITVVSAMSAVYLSAGYLVGKTLYQATHS